ncbi:hypothetical protein KCP73_03180 [Salmonella enterica subsp. enterica]|nr:hypothetical protein KCP73_03180 [Salmonella enterica subsp. enterica]
MKTIKYAVAAIAFHTLSLALLLAEPVSASQTQNLHKIGVVSADAPPRWMARWLAEKAAAAGAALTSHSAVVMTNERLRWL